MDISKSEVLKETPEVTEQADIKGITDTVEEKRAEAPTDIIVPEEVLHDNEAQAVMADKSDIPEKIIAAQPLDRPIEMLAVRQNVAAMPLTAAGEPAGTAIKKTMETREKKGEMIAEDSMISGLDEVVVVGYGNEQKAEDAFAGYSSPVPVGGKPAFESYISSNIRNPSSLAEGERAVVIVSIMVKNTGAIDSIKVVRSPGKEFSDEAIRLIKEGPAWNPATENGEKTDDEVRIRIVFK
jgi:TonB family protein